MFLFVIDHKRRITIVKGDTAIFDISMKNYEFVEGDEVYFTVRKSSDNLVAVIKKRVSTFKGRKAKILLSSDDTNIEAGAYLYDVQCSLFNGVVDTIIPPTRFEVVGGITHD